ncbi:MAG: hypothetical protein R2865_00880 [Deinococcales bacterium]
MTEARRLQLAYNPIALAVTSLYGVPALKAALRLRSLGKRVIRDAFAGCGGGVEAPENPHPKTAPLNKLKRVKVFKRVKVCNLDPNV